MPNVELDAAARRAHRDLLRHLLGIREKLMMVDPTSLDEEKHAAWTEQIYQVSLAIGYVRSVALGDVERDYADLVVEAEAALDAVTDDLYKIKRNVEAIRIVDGALGVVKEIVSLIR